MYYYLLIIIKIYKAFINNMNTIIIIMCVCVCVCVCV